MDRDTQVRSLQGVPTHGGMAERLKAPSWKGGDGRELVREFESPSLRQHAKYGRMAERLKAPVSKTDEGREILREFEFPSFRQQRLMTDLGILSQARMYCSAKTGSISPATIHGPVAQRESGCFASSGSGVRFSLGPPTHVGVASLETGTPCAFRPRSFGSSNLPADTITPGWPNLVEVSGSNPP